MQYDVLVSNSFWIIPLVVAVVQAIKMMGVATKFAPIISIGVGIGFAFLLNNDFTTPQMILSGVIYGLSASGLYSGVTFTQKVHDVKTGELPMNKIDKGALNQKDIQEIQKKQQSQQSQQGQQPAQPQPPAQQGQPPAQQNINILKP